MSYFFTPEEVDGLVKEGCEEGWRMEGECSVVEMEMANRAEGWGCTRRFVQGSWKKVKV
jgi:methyltransferase-like protein 6